jgi:hypothetical protein
VRALVGRSGEWAIVRPDVDPRNGWIIIHVPTNAVARRLRTKPLATKMLRDIEAVGVDAALAWWEEGRYD